tara:strand:- start:1691 stop:2092 length:402 start_codon:yes stop_codon:yes gene_type:complete
MVRHLLEEILEETKNKGYHYFIECEGNVLQDITNDPELCHATRDDEYAGVNATDSSDIFILKYDKDLPEDEWNSYQNEDGEWVTQKGYKNVSFIRWTNWNDGIERVWDYGLSLEKIIDINNIMEDWEERLNSL